jgi:predicted DNA-binding transcriptional regulator YafY
MEQLRRLCAAEVSKTHNAEVVSVSTIEKDLNAMRNEFDAPIKYSRTQHGYYYADPNYSLEGIPLSAGELESLRAAASTFSHFKNVSLFQQFGSAIDKLITRINTEHRIRNSDRLLIQFEEAPSSKGVEHLELLVEAAHSRRSVTFKHRKFTEESSTFYKVNPYMLKEYRNRWYLIGWSHNAMAMRTFGLDRIESVELTNDLFDHDPAFNAEDLFRYSVGITTSGGRPQTIEFEASETLSKYLITQPIHETQEIISRNDGRCTFSLHVLITSELLITLLGYGHSLKVTKPAQLIDLMKDEIRQMGDLYKV